MKALWKYESAIKIWKRFENMKALWKYESTLKIWKRLKIYKCPEIITGANFHFGTVELCILNNNYALCILLRKNPFFRWFCKHTWTHFKAHYWIKTTIILESWVLLLFSLPVFTTVCSSSDLVGSVSSLCVWRCGHLLVLLLSEEEVQWSPLYQLLPRTGLPWICPGCTGPAWFSWSASEKRFREARWLTCAGLDPGTSCLLLKGPGPLGSFSYSLVLLTRPVFNPHTAYSDVGGTTLFN